MLKALGISKKSKPASEDAIKKYKEQQSLRNQWRTDTQKIQAVISKLDQQYSLFKGDFGLSRYEGLKNMIKDAIQEHHSLIEATKHRSTEKYDAKIKAQGNSTGKITSLRHTAQGFASHNEERQKDYTDMTSKEIEEDLTRFRREILQYKAEYRAARDNVERLAKNYEESKKFNPPQRYNELKMMIKDIIRTPAELQQPVAGTASARVK